jgi:lactose/L-arabinose transport system substrate-binding protein
MMDNMKKYAPDTAGDWGVFRIPAMRPGGIRVSNMGGSTLSIPSQSEHPQEAWKFIEYALCTVEGQVAQYRTFGIFPAYLPALKDPYFDQPDPFFGGQKIHRLFATDIDKIPAVTRTREWNDADRMMRQRLSEWAETGLDDETFLRETQRALSVKLAHEIAPESEGAAKQ